jgi:hypothetical protein
MRHIRVIHLLEEVHDVLVFPQGNKGRDVAKVCRASIMHGVGSPSGL